MSRIAIYAGSFDPVTQGHYDLIQRSLEFVDRLVVAVATNIAKQPLFTADERVKFIQAAVGDDKRVEVRQFHGLLVDFAKEVNARLIIRGLRAVSDFEYEYQMALMNRHLSPRLETVFMVPSLDTTYTQDSTAYTGPPLTPDNDPKCTGSTAPADSKPSLTITGPDSKRYRVDVYIAADSVNAARPLKRVTVVIRDGNTPTKVYARVASTFDEATGS